MKPNFEQKEDIELYYLMRGGTKTSEKAFAELYIRYSPRIYAYCRRFLGNKQDAQDVFQESFVRFYQSSQQERVMTNIPAFLLKIARNLCVNFKKRTHKPVTLEDYIHSEPDRHDKDELLNLIKTTLDLLPQEYRELFILREYEYLTYHEIAELTGISLATVKIRLFRAKQKIRDILAPYLSEIDKFF